MIHMLFLKYCITLLSVDTLETGSTTTQHFLVTKFHCQQALDKTVAENFQRNTAPVISEEIFAPELTGNMLF